MADYDEMTDDQLREELASRDLVTTGDREDLISRLKENDASGNNDDGPSQTDTSDDSNKTGGEHGTQEDADRSGQRPAPGDPRE